MEGKKHLRRLSSIYAVGIIGHLLPWTKEIMSYLTAPVLFLTFIYIVYHLRKELSTKVIILFFISYIVTFILEALGVETGLIFGEYVYGDVLGPKLFKTPVLIGLLWVFVVWGAYQINQKFVKNKVLLVLTTGLSAVLFDILLEPVAIKLGYWTWAGGVIPLQNYLAWGIIGMFIAATLAFSKTKIRNPILSYFFMIQFIFFAVLGVLL